MKKTELFASYAGIPTFYKVPFVDPEKVEEGMVVIAGVPLDMGIVVARTGARFGPREIREASSMYRGLQEAGDPPVSIDVDTQVALQLKDHLNVVDIGDFTVYPQDLMESTESIIQGVAEVVRRGGKPIVLGGDHYITYPCFEGFAKGMAESKPDARLGYVHIDSHPDFREGYRGLGRYNHATSARRLSENPMISYKNMAWVGLNGPVMDKDVYTSFQKHNFKMFTAKTIRNRGMDDVIREAMETAADSVDVVYVTVDIDVVHSGFAPGTGIPGFEGIEAMDLLDAMAYLSTCDIVGALDLCEVSPPLDPTGRTAHLAASGLLGFLSRHLFDKVTIEV